jgi:hypothetical protein
MVINIFRDIVGRYEKRIMSERYENKKLLKNSDNAYFNIPICKFNIMRLECGKKTGWKRVVIGTNKYAPRVETDFFYAARSSFKQRGKGTNRYA